MKIEIVPERDGRVVIAILPEEEGKAKVELVEKDSPLEKDSPQGEKAEDVVVKDVEAVQESLESDPHAQEEIQEAMKRKESHR
ncbi:MAG: hypothetical protein QMD88_00115 [Coprothermobacterota bacterium]|nr:hypothetical protein [Coprothermobacterota bacterium]